MIIKGIVTALVLYAQQATHTTEIAFAPPEIQFAAQYDIAVKACGTLKCNVHALFSYEKNRIYLRDDLDIVNNLYDRSILLHEIVHYLQHNINEPQMKNACHTWKAREIAAYHVQYQWLYENQVRVKTSAFNARLVNFDNMC